MEILFIVFFAALALLLLVFFGAWFLYMRSLAFRVPPFITVPRDILPDIIAALALAEDSVLYDLGCGEGRVLGEALKDMPNARGVGIEIDFLPYFLAKRKLRRMKNIAIRRGDFFRTNLGNATHVFGYLYPSIMAEIEAKFEKDLRPGTRFVSCDFALPGRKPVRIIDLKRPGKRGERLLVYEF